MEDHQQGEDKDRWDKLFMAGTDSKFGQQGGQTWRDIWNNFCVNGVI